MTVATDAVPARTGARTGTASARVVVVAVTTLAVLLGPLGPASARTSGDAADRDPTAARALLERARVSTAAPHEGDVTVVSFTETGPTVTGLHVTVDAAGVVLREPTAVLVGAAPDPQHSPTSPLGFDVAAILDGWDVSVGQRVTLDTGPATPVHLVRSSGAAIRETLFLDDATGLAVRRETRDVDGDVLRVVAYTSLDRHAVAGPRGWQATATGLATLRAEADRDRSAALDVARTEGFAVPSELAGGFGLLSARVDDEMAVARYGDGLSVLSVYQQVGALDPDALEDAVIDHVAGRDVWTWPGSEPARFVWTGDDRTWTAVSDAPAPVVRDALASLPGDLVGHDAPHRLRRGLDRVWQFITGPMR